jgi:hypothetical protein
MKIWRLFYTLWRKQKEKKSLSFKVYTKVEWYFKKLGFSINASSFYVIKTVLVGPKWFWSDQIDLDLTIMVWFRPKWNGHDQNELVRSKLWFSTKMNHIWNWPIHFGHDHLILVVNISLWSSPNQFGKTKTILDQPNLFWSHRRTRH